MFEHKTSIVTLHCEIEESADASAEVKVMWLLSDEVLEPSDDVQIVKPVIEVFYSNSIQKRGGEGT